MLQIKYSALNVKPKACSNHHVADEIYHLLKPLGMKKSTEEPIPSWESVGLLPALHTALI